MNESEIISAFLKPVNKERIKSLLSSKKGREKFVSTLSHYFIDKVEPKYIKKVFGTKKDVVNSVTIYFNKKEFNIISEYAEFEIMDSELKDALENIVGFGMGTIIYSIDGSIMYYEGEDQNANYIISKNAI